MWTSCGRELEISGLGRSANASGGFVWETTGRAMENSQGVVGGVGEKQRGLLGAETKMKEGEQI